MTGYDQEDLRIAASAAIRAPSLHNSQPWRFRLRAGAVEIRADRSRQLPMPQRAFSDRRRGPGRDFEPEPLIAVLSTVADRPADQITAGQALQRLLLTVTDAGLAASMMSQPIEVPSARDRLRRSLGRAGVPQMTLRIGWGDPGSTTRRRDLVLPE